MVSTHDLAEFVNEFAVHVAAQTDAIGRGDAKTGNRHARRYLNAFDRLRAAGDSGREALTALFQHERLDVRAMAAAFLLRYCTKEAKAVLDDVARSGPSLEAFGAAEALKRWDEGTWTLDLVVMSPEAIDGMRAVIRLFREGRIPLHVLAAALEPPLGSGEGNSDALFQQLRQEWGELETLNALALEASEAGRSSPDFRDPVMAIVERIDRLLQR